jgi:hypothetical protein
VKNSVVMKTAEPPANADFLVYGHGSSVLVEPRNATAKVYLETTVSDDVLGWFRGAPVVEKSSVVPLMHKLIAAGFKVVGQKAFVQAPRLYVRNGKWWLYTGGRAIPTKLILNGAGTPN